MRIDTEYHFKIKDELEALKVLVRQFLEAIEYVPFRAIDCDQNTVEDLWEKLADAVEEQKK